MHTAAPTHNNETPTTKIDKSGWDVLGEATFALCKVGGVATAGAMVGGRLGGWVGLFVGVLLLVATYALRRRERS
jgi:hypothetical protein